MPPDFSPSEPTWGRVHPDAWPPFAARLPHGQVDWVFADPPYHLDAPTTLRRKGRAALTHNFPWDRFTSEEDYERLVRTWLAAAVAVLAPHGSLLWWTLVERIGFV